MCSRLERQWHSWSGCYRFQSLQRDSTTSTSRLAERLLRRSIELDPQSVPSVANLIYHLTWAGRELDALREADEAVRRLPTDVKVLRARATVLLWLRRPDDLERQLRDVVRIAPRSSQDEWEFAVADLLRGQDQTAATQFALIVQRPPQVLRAIERRASGDNSR